MTRYLNSFFITMVLYLFAVFFFFFLFADSVIIPEKEERIISINHIKVAQQQPTPQESVSEPVPEKEVEPEPIVEKKIHKPKKEKRHEEKRHEEKKREHKKPIQEPIKQIVEEPKEEVVPNIKPVENTPISNELENLEALYLSQLRAKIEKNKVYPNSAKRLNQKGKVYVTFTLSKDGQITNIKISKSSDFDKLDEAALKILTDIKAIEPIPKELNKNSWEITVPIVYQIK